ncbi:DNA polymerase III subunit beta [soil metagenome]
MKITLERDMFLQKMQIASRFVSDKLNASSALQGVFIKTEPEKIHLYATNLNMYYHTSLAISVPEEIQSIIEPKKIIEFMQLLQPGMIDILFEENQLTITQGKTKGVFPVIVSEEFPLPPDLLEEKQTISSKFLLDNLPFILFTASTDDARPVLTGINFVVTDDELLIVSTDGFRLSMLKEKSKGTFSSMIIPAEFLRELIRNIDEKTEVRFVHSKKENIVLFSANDDFYYTRLIDGEFPPFEKVIPAEKTETVVLKKEDLLRNTKLISIFARDYSNVIIYEFNNDGLVLRPKKEANKENTTSQDIQHEGESHAVAFNYRYVLDFLNHTKSPDIVVEILRGDAPVVFKEKGNENFVHIIMPVRIQE